MKLVVAIILANLSGCAIVYTGASTATLVTTGKSIPEHAASGVTGSDCNVVNYVFRDRDYLCEQRDIAKTYNRNPF